MAIAEKRVKGLIRMRLIVDCFNLVKGQGKSIGISNLTKNLITNLAQENEKTKQIEEIVVLGTEKNREDFEIPGVTFAGVLHDPADKIQCVLWELFWVKKYVKKYNGDRVLFPRGYAPLFYGGKDTIIIHDLIPFYYHENYPGVFNPIENFYIMSRLKGSIKHADQVITISEYSRSEIERRVPSAKGKVRVIYNGLNGLPSLREDKISEEKKTAYLCAMTSRLPHKNAKGILEAYKVYWSKTKKPLPIKIIGIESADQFGIGEAAKDVICYPYIKDDKELLEIIAGSRAFLFLSLIEGFGFPPLEAMQLGVPVICSDRTSLPEVIADAAVAVDPEKPEIIADEIIRLLKDKELCEMLIRKGRENYKRFDWDRIIRQYMEELTR